MSTFFGVQLALCGSPLEAALSTPAASPPASFLNVFETEADLDLAGFLPSDLAPFARPLLAEMWFKEYVSQCMKSGSQITNCPKEFGDKYVFCIYI